MEAAPVLDTDVLIDYLRGTGAGRDLVRVLRERLAFRITAVTAFELVLGREYERAPDQADTLLCAPCLGITLEAGVRAGSLLRELRAAGRGIDVRDAMQAGVCLVAGAPLVTRNVGHFDRIPELEVVPPDAWPRG